MRGIHSVVDDIRRDVFEEVARLAYEGGDYSRIDALPYKIVPGEIAHYRKDVFLERAIVTERIRLACGLPLRTAGVHALASDGIEEAAQPEKYYEPPLINIIPFACNACPPKEIRISDSCQGCLSHPCKAVCPKDAIIIDNNGKSSIDKEKCIKCGRCAQQCPYNAITKIERPCAAACGMDAIGSDEYGRAKIDYDKCVSCGMCLVNCPFAAISDKSQIFQLIQAAKSGKELIACVAPAFVRQFGADVTLGKLKTAMRVLGFADVVEVAVGADMCALEEATDFLRNVPDRQAFMATSCCPAWSVMAKKLFPEFRNNISMTHTPMVITARLIKEQKPEACIVFIGPCAAKKLEASRSSVRSEVDFVLTFEELQGMFAAKNIDFSAIDEDVEESCLTASTAAGRGFAVTGGVAEAVADVIAQIAPEREVSMERADGLRDCRKMLMMAKAGKRNGYLLEGMACPGGCVAGAGTIAPVPQAAAAVRDYKKSAPMTSALESPYNEEEPTPQ
ncbi:MAG: 4Fe-4S dicluster domain-containing protein [Oscillospiraceae bacterium]